MLRILDSKEEEDLDVLLSAPKLFDYLTTAAKEHFLEVGAKGWGILLINIYTRLKRCSGS